MAHGLMTAIRLVTVSLPPGEMGPCGTPPTAAEELAWLMDGGDEIIANGSVVTETDVMTWSVMNLGGEMSNHVDGVGNVITVVSFPDIETALQDAVELDLENASNLLLGRVVLEMIRLGLITPMDGADIMASLDLLDAWDTAIIFQLENLRDTVEQAPTQLDIIEIHQRLDRIEYLILTHRH